jgi:hypothetical protein
MARRHGEHDLDPLALGDALEGMVNKVEVARLHLPPVGEDGGKGARRPVHGHLTLDACQLHAQVR